MTKKEILEKFNDIDFAYNDSSKHETLSRMLDELLKEQETANLYKCPNCGTWVSAENVVRCKDCKHFAETQMGSPRAEKRKYVCDEFNPPCDWFCADGERK